jgi:hypothetical protein
MRGRVRVREGNPNTMQGVGTRSLEGDGLAIYLFFFYFLFSFLPQSPLQGWQGSNGQGSIG